MEDYCKLAEFDMNKVRAIPAPHLPVSAMTDDEMSVTRTVAQACIKGAHASTLVITVVSTGLGFYNRSSGQQGDNLEQI